VQHGETLSQKNPTKLGQNEKHKEPPIAVLLDVGCRLSGTRAFALCWSRVKAVTRTEPALRVEGKEE
jgi:hypothetical protein